MAEASTKKEGALHFLIGKFEECDDIRQEGMIKYTLSEILFLIFCGLLSGCEKYEDIIDFGEFKLDWLRKFSSYTYGIPSHDTIRRVLSVINTKQLEKALTEFSSYGIELSNGTIINIDGKWLSGSATIKEKRTKASKGGKSAINMVNVYCSELDRCLASMRVCSKSGEKNALSEILKLLDLSHCLITMDAGYCYKDVAKTIIDSEADYVIGLKANQPKLLEAAKDLLTNSPATESHTDNQTDSHGRLEQRFCKVINFSNLDKKYRDEYNSIFEDWAGLKCLVEVTCKKTIKATKKTTSESRFYISSEELMPKKANEVVRGHWHVENKLHWVLDVIMGEDRSRKRSGNSAQNLSIIRKMALNRLKSFEDPKTSIRRRSRKCAMDNKYLEKILQN